MARYEGQASVRRALSLPDGSALLDIKPESLNWQWAQVSPERAREALAVALAAINGGWKLYLSLPDDPNSNLLDIVGLSRTPDRPEAPVPTGSAAAGDDAQPGELLMVDQPLTSANGQFFLVFQGDANLVLYRNDGTPLWASDTAGNSIGACVMQADGNLVIYDAMAVPIWASNTDQHPGSGLVVQDDGNVVIYRPDGTAVWATNTAQPILPTGSAAAGDDAQPGELLMVDQPLTSANGQFFLVFQGDANLVLYRNDGTPLWASDTAGNSIGACVMQADGNLVIYDAMAVPIWASNTDQHPGSGLVVQDDGNVVIYRPDGTAVWATNTV